MENSNLQPVLFAGQVEEKCYGTIQELFEEFASKLQIPIDTISVIKGAKGDTGDRGQRGLKGEQGDKGDGAATTIQRYAIPNAATYLDVPIFDQWEKAAFKISVNATIGGDNPFDPATAGVVGVGTIIQVSATPIQFLRCFFTFAGGITSVPASNHILIITDVR